MRAKHCGLLLLFYELLAKMLACRKNVCCAWSGAVEEVENPGEFLFAMICSSRNVMVSMNYGGTSPDPAAPFRYLKACTQ